MVYAPPTLKKKKAPGNKTRIPVNAGKDDNQATCTSDASNTLIANIGLNAVVKLVATTEKIPWIVLIRTL